MYNYNSPIIQNMIQSGQLQPREFNPYTGEVTTPQQQLPYQPQQQYYGYQQPQQQYYGYGYNQPVQQFNNTIPFGYNGYNQQPQQQNEYVFRPAGGGYDYGYYQPQQQYYGYQQPQQYGYGYYNNNIDPFLLTTMDQNGNIVFHNGPLQPSQIVELQNREIEMEKLKARQVAKYFHQEVDEDALDRRFNPNHPDNQKRVREYDSPELQELKRMQQLTNLIDHPIMETQAMQTARLIHDMSANFHREYDGMSLCEFLEDHLWKFQREWWIRDNIDFKNSRNLSETYSGNSYKDLLNLHRGSNPYAAALLDTSRYDNNLDDPEIGLPAALMEAKRRKSILEGPVPNFISTPEIQKERHEWINQLTGMINAKKNMNYNKMLENNNTQ